VAARIARGVPVRMIQAVQHQCFANGYGNWFKVWTADLAGHSWLQEWTGPGSCQFGARFSLGWQRLEPRAGSGSRRGDDWNHPTGRQVSKSGSCRRNQEAVRVHNLLWRKTLIEPPPSTIISVIARKPVDLSTCRPVDAARRAAAGAAGAESERHEAGAQIWRSQRRPTRCARLRRPGRTDVPGETLGARALLLLLAGEEDLPRTGRLAAPPPPRRPIGAGRLRRLVSARLPRGWRQMVSRMTARGIYHATRRALPVPEPYHRIRVPAS
jgi:hypothetical protein